MITLIKEGNILECQEKVIAHQCSISLIASNREASGLASQIFSKYREADDYKRTSIDYLADHLNYNSVRLGCCTKYYVERNSRVVLNCYTQFNPGKPNQSNNDTAEKRLLSLEWCLDSIYHLIYNKDTSDPIAFPYNYGCGLAGGDWEAYERVFDKAKLPVVLYKYTSPVL